MHCSDSWWLLKRKFKTWQIFPLFGLTHFCTNNVSHERLLYVLGDSSAGNSPDFPAQPQATEEGIFLWGATNLAILGQAAHTVRVRKFKLTSCKFEQV
jgi:hypothetical protein